MSKKQKKEDTMNKNEINEENMQVIYINMDDSGRLVKGEPNELVFVYGGVFFLSLEEQENFSRQYSSVVVKVKYKNSYYNYPVQAADLLVGEVRHAYYNYIQDKNFNEYRKRTNFLNTSIYLP
jgi:hypothetical protein